MLRVAVAVLLLAAVPAAAQEGQYLFDLLKRPTYRAAWERMLAGAKVDPWLASYSHNLDGPTTPAEPVAVGKDTGFALTVCKAHDCGDNALVVVFAAGGRHAAGLLDVAGAMTRFLGDPSPAERDALIAFSKR